MMDSKNIKPKHVFHATKFIEKIGIKEILKKESIKKKIYRKK